MALRFAELREGGWAHVPVGAATSLAALADELAALREAPGCNVVVLSGDSFAADDAPRPGERLSWLELFELPTVYAVEGALRGPSFDLALACDIRVCTAAATLRATSVGSPRMLRVVDQSKAVELMKRRMTVDAATALEFGLVSAVAAPGETALDCAARLSAVIASRGPIATRLAKEAIWRGLEMSLEQGLRFETDLTLLLQTTKDRAEGVRAFVEKRAPHFTGE
jgi:enoyl-CoA hydratase/carnithine racemase